MFLTGALAASEEARLEIIAYEFVEQARMPSAGPQSTGGFDTTYASVCIGGYNVLQSVLRFPWRLWSAIVTCELMCAACYEALRPAFATDYARCRAQPADVCHTTLTVCCIAGYAAESSKPK